jgi:putative tricarboxylic transport membrane protein
MTINRDTLVAIVLLFVCGGLAMASLEIREPDYGQLSPATWPRTIIGVMTVLCFIYLIQSLRQGPDEPDPNAPADLASFLAYWRNVIWIFVLFLGYLLILPAAGMLLGGMAFVFLVLTALGGYSSRALVLHAVIAVLSVGGMWLLFTYALGVFLPRGELTGI